MSGGTGYNNQSSQTPGCNCGCGNNKPPSCGCGSSNPPSCGCRNNKTPSCGCGNSNPPSRGCNPNCDAESSLYNDQLKGMALAIGYVPWQQWCKVYDLCKGLNQGTIFPPLDLQFCGCIPKGYFKGQGGAL